jgi:methionyl-tRNA formyltransferase
MENDMTSCLFIGDPNLGDVGSHVVRSCFPGAEVAIWAYGDAVGKERIRQKIRSRRWSLTFSFYSDLVLQKEDLACMDLPLNIHPALPEIPGLGYDVVPISQSHSHYGTTLHWMDTRVDSGEIFDIAEYLLPVKCDRLTLRKRNQAASIEMLKRWVPRLAAYPDMESRVRMLRGTGRADRGWSNSYITRKQLQAMLLSECPTLSGRESWVPGTVAENM